LVAKAPERHIIGGITDGSMGRSIWKLAGPMMIGGALQDLLSLVDLYFVGRLGHVQVAALSIAGAAVAVLIMLVAGISTGTMALVSQFTGRGEHDRADDVLAQSMLLGVVASALMVGMAAFGVKPLLVLFGATGDVLGLAAEYLFIVFAWSPAMFFGMAIGQALRGSGDAVTPLKVLVIVNAINIALDPVLIFGYGPFAARGVAGSAIATVISRGLGLALLLWHTTKGHSTLRLRWHYLRPNVPLTKSIVSIGMYASLQSFIRQISFLLLMRLVASFGAITLAAYGIGNRLRMVIMVPGFGLASASAVVVGQNLGAERPRRAKLAAWRTVLYYECFAVPVAAMYVVLARHIVGLFTDHPEVIGTGATFLRYLGVTFPFLAFSLVLGQSMNGAGDTRTPTVVTAFGQLLFRIPLAYLLALVAALGTTGIWLGINASDIAQGLLMVLLFQTGVWQRAYLRHQAALGVSPASPGPGSAGEQMEPGRWPGASD
jgi:putative MATE family efflux protein